MPETSVGGDAAPGETPGDVTTMSEGVVATIATLATRAVPGVVATAGAAPTATVRLGETRVAVDVTLVADHGTDLVALADDVRRAVAAAVLRMTDLRVSEVDVTVADVH